MYSRILNILVEQGRRPKMPPGLEDLSPGGFVPVKPAKNKSTNVPPRTPEYLRKNPQAMFGSLNAAGNPTKIKQPKTNQGKLR